MKAITIPAGPALGIFDALSPAALASLRSGDASDRATGARVGIPRARLIELLNAIEAARPGILDIYESERRERS